jgi:hypothetical protein
MINSINDKYRNVSAESIMRSACDYLRPEKRVILNYIPKLQ